MRWLIGLVAVLLAGGPAEPQPTRSSNYAAVQGRLQRGWNSWDTNTVTGQVLLPYGLQIRLGVKKASSENTDAFLGGALIGRKRADEETSQPARRSVEGRAGGGNVTSICLNSLAGALPRRQKDQNKVRRISWDNSNSAAALPSMRA